MKPRGQKSSTQAGPPALSIPGPGSGQVVVRGGEFHGARLSYAGRVTCGARRRRCRRRPAKQRRGARLALVSPKPTRTNATTRSICVAMATTPSPAPHYRTPPPLQGETY